MICIFVGAIDLGSGNFNSLFFPIVFRASNKPPLPYQLDKDSIAQVRIPFYLSSLVSDQAICDALFGRGAHSVRTERDKCKLMQTNVTHGPHVFLYSCTINIQCHAQLWEEYFQERRRSLNALGYMVTHLRAHFYGH